MDAGTVTATTKENLNSDGTIFISGESYHIYLSYECVTQKIYLLELTSNTTVIRGMTFYLVVEEVMKALALRRALGYMGDSVRVKERSKLYLISK